MVNPGAPLFPISCRTGNGLDPWLTWLLEKRSAFKHSSIDAGVASGKSPLIEKARQ
jgi:hypothetical protein